MANISYEARLVMLGMESLETRRLKLDMQFAYKILFGVMSREAGWSPENTSSVTELLNPGIIYQPSHSTSNPTILFIPF
jgi:hypothetical protein